MGGAIRQLYRPRCQQPRRIGAAIALRLAKGGYDIWLNYRSNHQAADMVAGQVRALGRQCTLLPFDVSDASAVNEALVPRLKDQAPYILVNNSGINRNGLLFWMPREDWKDVLDISLDGFYHVTRHVVGLMVQQKRWAERPSMSTLLDAGLKERERADEAREAARTFWHRKELHRRRGDITKWPWLEGDDDE